MFQFGLNGVSYTIEIVASLVTSKQ